MTHSNGILFQKSTDIFINDQGYEKQLKCSKGSKVNFPKCVKLYLNIPKQGTFLFCQFKLFIVLIFDLNNYRMILFLRSNPQIKIFVPHGVRIFGSRG